MPSPPRAARTPRARPAESAPRLLLGAVRPDGQLAVTTERQAPERIVVHRTSGVLAVGVEHVAGPALPDELVVCVPVALSWPPGGVGAPDSGRASGVDSQRDGTNHARLWVKVLTRADFILTSAGAAEPAGSRQP